MAIFLSPETTVTIPGLTRTSLTSPHRIIPENGCRIPSRPKRIPSCRHMAIKIKNSKPVVNATIATSLTSIPGRRTPKIISRQTRSNTPIGPPRPTTIIHLGRRVGSGAVLIISPASILRSSAAIGQRRFATPFDGLCRDRGLAVLLHPLRSHPTWWLTAPCRPARSCPGSRSPCARSPRP
jgi:hypothetical protein